MTYGSRGLARHFAGRYAKRVFAASLVLLVGWVLVGMPAAEAARRHHTRYRMPASRTDPAKDAALIIDGVSGKVLYSRNADAARHPASLTKLMTIYLLLDAVKKGQVKLTDTMTFSRHAARQKPTNLHVSTGKSISVEIALDAMIVRSANDVAVAVAEMLGGTEGHFAVMMTSTARRLGMRNTFFHNASGLPDRLQLTTATDMAILARHVAYDFPEYYHYFAKREFIYGGTRFEGHNNLLGHYEGADGMKTGYTVASGFNLVSSVTRNNVHVIGVVMGGRTANRRDKEMMILLDKAFDTIAAKPTLVAHAALPWRGLSDQAGIRTASLPNPKVMPAPRPSVGSDPNDEDVAEATPDIEEDAPAAPAAMVATYRPTHPPSPTTAKPMPRPETRLSLGIHDWTIQIGAFADFGQAQAMLASYAEKSMDVLGQARRIVVPFQSLDGQWLYRARFGPFLEREARQICSRLTERGQTCFAAIATR